MPPWSLQNSKNWKKITCWKKLAKKKNIFCTGPPPPPELHIRIVKQNPNFMYPGTWNFVFSSNPCTRVHDIMFFLQIYVPPGTWNFDSSSNPCTPVHEIWILFHYLCIALGVEVARCKKYFFFCQIFSTCKKIIQFLEFCKDQGGKI